MKDERKNIKHPRAHPLQVQWAFPLLLAKLLGRLTLEVYPAPSHHPTIPGSILELYSIMDETMSVSATPRMLRGGWIDENKKFY